MKLAVDMNLSPIWIEYFQAAALAAEHWGLSAIRGRVIEKSWRTRGSMGSWCSPTNLDFGNILAVTQALGPSVIQVRTHDPMPDVVGELVLAAIEEHGLLLERGALVTIEPDKLRARVLPIVPGARR